MRAILEMVLGMSLYISVRVSVIENQQISESDRPTKGKESSKGA